MYTQTPCSKMLASLLMVFLLTIAQASFAMLDIKIVNKDASGEGFNDTTPFTPVGGNPSHTLGQARYFAFQFAAHIWGSYLTSNVKVEVNAQFDPLPCDTTGAILGKAGASVVLRDFDVAAGSPRKIQPLTWYPQALANSFAGKDLAPSDADIGLTLNSQLDAGSASCMGGTKWYYGIDGSPPTGSIDLVTVVLHELAHGLGFQTFVNLSTGAKPAGFDDTFMLNLKHNGATPDLYQNMTVDSQRVTASTSGNLFWTQRIDKPQFSPDLKLQRTAVYTKAGGDVQMYAPASQKPGSSVSHFNNNSQLMGAYYSGPNHNLGYALPLLKDIGWELSEPGIDIVIIMDITGSTLSLTTDWYTKLQTMMAEWQKVNPAVRFALVSHYDFPFSPYGKSGEWAYRMESNFEGFDVQGVQAVANAINALKPLSYSGAGADGPESQYEAIYQVLTNGEGLHLDADIDYNDPGEIIPSPLGISHPLVIYHFTTESEGTGIPGCYPCFHDPEKEPNYPTPAYNSKVRGHDAVHNKLMSDETMFFGVVLVNRDATTTIRRGVRDGERPESVGELKELADLTGGTVLYLEKDLSNFESAIKESVSMWTQSLQGNKQLDEDNGRIFNNDNCLDTFNPDQADSDGDGIGDACDSESVVSQKFPLQVTKVGEGTLTLQDVDCETNCVRDYAINTEVKLVAIPANGYQFAGWSGDCVSDTVMMDTAKNCVANFTAIHYSVIGTLLNAKGEPLVGVTIQTGDHITTTDNSGNWQIADLTTGDYTFTASKDGYTFVPAQVTLAGQETTHSVTLIVLTEPQGLYTAHGTLKDQAGKPIANATVQVGDKTTTTDTLGNWEIPGFFEGTYDVFATKDNYSCLQSDIELGNQEYLTAVSCEPINALKVFVKSNASGNVEQGDELTYTITVVNGGNQTATGVTLVETLPQGSELISLEALDGGVCDASTLTCTLADLTPGVTAKFKLVLRNPTAKALKNIVTVASNEYPVEVRSNWHKVKPYLSLLGKSVPNPVEIGKQLHYVLKAELLSRSPETTAKDVKAEITLPAEVKFLSATATQGTCEWVGNKVVCQLGDLSIVNSDDVSSIVIDVGVELIDGGLLQTNVETKLSSSNHPEHRDVIRTALRLGEAQVDGIILLDVTGSMGQELQSVIAAVKEKLTAQYANGAKPLIALASFRDSVRLESASTDLNVLLKALEKLEAKEGGLCAEASAEALTLALKYLKPKGTIIFASDAPPYDGTDIAVLKAKIAEKQATFIPILTISDCAPNELAQ